MAKNSDIEWTHDTFNPWRGCTKISPGCANCYAEKLSGRNPAVLGEWGPGGTRVVAAESYWGEPLKWDRQAQKAGERRRVFCASLADVFEDWQGPMVDRRGFQLWKRTTTVEPARGVTGELYGGKWTTSDDYPDTVALTMDDVLERVLFLIRDTPNIDWLLLTKRPENILSTFSRLDVCDPDACLPNLWLGVSVEDQQRADERIALLLQCPAAVRFLSVEPLLGPLDVTKHLRVPVPCPDGIPGCEVLHYGPSIDWVIVGGESGPGARPMHPNWARRLRDQCQEAGVPFFFKQWGEYLPFTPNYQGVVLADKATGELQGVRVDGHFITDVEYSEDSDVIFARVGKKAAGRIIDGQEWSQFPSAKGIGT